jgi:hypothetical protein
MDASATAMLDEVLRWTLALRPGAEPGAGLVTSAAPR